MPLAIKDKHKNDIPYNENANINELFWFMTNPKIIHFHTNIHLIHTIILFVS